jgi:hypothetical protein
LFPPTANTYAKPDGTIVTGSSQGGVVGSIPGQFDVSFTGAATYTVPVECPPGIQGMQPNIFLTYNSQGGNSIAGWGWNLGGISAISRTGSDLYHDAKNATIELTNSDNLVLDGQRLVLVSGSHFASGAKYRTEIETFSDITYKSINGYLCFEVTTKEGKTMEYGSSSDSYIEAQGKSTSLLWLLRKVTDPNGNYILYNYGENNANGEYWLSKITYTGNTLASTSPANEIEFLYASTRSDSLVYYHAGSKAMQTKLLTSIKTKTNAQILREYSFTYNYDGFYTKLSEINLKTPEGVKYNPTIINWDNPDSGNPKLNVKNVSLESMTSFDESILFIDLNNDGYADMIKPIMDQATGLRAGGYAYMGWNTYLSDKGQDFILEQEEDSETAPSKYLLSGTLQLIPVDFNKDGFMDIAEICKNGNNIYEIDILLNENGLLVRKNLTELNFSTSNSYDVCHFDFQDFDGDGNIELLYRRKPSNSQYIYMYLYKININSNTKTLLTSTSVQSTFDKEVKISDVNGNGKADILFLYRKEVYEYDTASTQLKKLSFTAMSNEGIDFKSVECLDINGDGKTDLFCYNDQSENWSIGLSTGSSFASIPSPITRSRSMNDYYEYLDHYFFSDYNADGKSDIIEIYTENGSKIINIYYFTGNKFVKETYNTNEQLAKIYCNRFIPYFDTNGDGKCDLIGSSYDGFSIFSFQTDETYRRASAVNNGLNQKQTITYKPLTNDTVYSKGNTTYSYPVIKSIYPLYVVSQTEMTSGNLSEIKSFLYKGLKIHREGKGALGFDEFTEKNTTQNTKKTVLFGYNST